MTRLSQQHSRPSGSSRSSRHRPILPAIFLTCLSCLPVLAFGGWIVWSASSVVGQVSLSQAQAKAGEAMGAIEALLLERRGDLLMLADMSAVKGLDPAFVSPAVDRLVMAKQPAYRLALVADAQGQILAVNQVDGAGRPIASGAVIGQIVAQESWFQDALRAVKPVAVEGFQVDPLTQAVFGAGPPVLRMSVPIKDDLGTVTGVLSVRLALQPVQAILTQHGRPDPSGHAYSLVLANKDGQPIAGPAELPQAGQTPSATVPAMGFLAASGLNWRLAAYETEARSVLPEQGLALLGLGLSVLLTVGGVAWTVTQRNRSTDTEPVGSTMEAAQAYREQQIIFDSVPAMVFYKDRNNRILRTNKAAAASIGKPVEEVEGKLAQELWPDESGRYHQDDLAVIQSGRPKVGIIEPYHTASGEKRWVRTDKIPHRDDQGAVIGVIVFAVDITEQVRAEELLRGTQQALEARVSERTAELSQMVETLQREAAERKKAETALDQSEEQVRQLQRMEAVGRLAGDVAHDFNNLLTIILGHSELLLKDLDPQAPSFHAVDEISKAAGQASALAQHLLTFSRKQPRQLQRLNLNDLITAQIPALGRVLGNRNRLVTSLTPDLGLVLVDTSQVEQVLLNLCLNAREAMPDGGTVTIETRGVTVDEAFVQRHIQSKPGAYVMLVVTDQGVGMDDYVQAHCFEPFFTTKPKGEATGLGLSTVYGIVKQNGGFVEIVSAPGQGTTFKVYLPCAEAPASATAPPPGSQKLPRGTETLLLVEDEAGLRMLLWRVLEQQGYTVLDASSGSAALGLASNHQGPIHLLVTDVVMPEMNGAELARLLSPARPEMKVLYISGYPDETVESHGVADPQTTMLPKPFTPERLARKVREVLDRPAERSAEAGGP
ncbi:MAG: response regulator [Nitrospirae bacterium]|nr:MAG: response regulator [Nitrospirota bacterium]